MSEPVLDFKPIPDLLQRAAKLWPMRLLHIPSMTSFTRATFTLENGHDTVYYGGVQEPKYNAISYTWGRWPGHKGGPVLPVQNMSWEIPPVEAAHFTVEELTKALGVVGERVEYVWIDIACIDQENTASKMLEVGRQAGIFSRAARVFAWLGQSKATLQTSLEAIDDLKEKMLKTMRFISQAGKESTYLEYLTRDMPSWVATITALSDLFADRWFTSLWTLQEAYLRSDALFLSRDSVIVSTERINNFAAAIKSINMSCEALEDTLKYGGEAVSRLLDPALVEPWHRVLFLAEVSGFRACYFTNPVGLLAATRFRQTRDPLDRIYAIMQVYGLVLGEAQTPGCKVSIESLQLELDLSLNQMSPMLAQNFLHTQVPSLGQKWRITESHNLGRLSENILNGEAYSLCKLSLRGETPFIVGLMCSFDKLLALWSFLRGQEEKEIGYQLFLDDSEVAPLSECANSTWLEFERLDWIANILTGHFGSSLKMAVLGKIEYPYGDSGFARWMGLLVQAEEVHGNEVWSRVGLWKVDGEAEISTMPITGETDNRDLWERIEGPLG